MQKIAYKFIGQFPERFFMIVIALTAKMAKLSFYFGRTVFTFVSSIFVHSNQINKLNLPIPDLIVI